MSDRASQEQSADFRRVGSDIPFYSAFGALAGMYVLLILAMLVSVATYTTPSHIISALQSEDIQYSMKLSLFSCTATTILSLWVAVPIGYLMARHRFPGKVLMDSVLDIPIVLPPLVIGLCLLIFFQTEAGKLIESLYLAVHNGVGNLIGKLPGVRFRELANITYEIPAVILAQFMVACAFAVRTMRVAFDQIDPRFEEVALTLGCSRSQAFWSVVFPQAHRGILAAGTLAWARSLGEFGPILIFAGATRGKTEVLSTSVFLELTVGNIEGAVAASMIMVTAAVIVLVFARVFGLKRMAM